MIVNMKLTEVIQESSSTTKNATAAIKSYNTRVAAQEAYNQVLVVRHRLPSVEHIIAKDPEYALEYATNILKTPWPMGEPAIATQGWTALDYALLVLNGSFPTGEKAISKNAEYSFYYATKVLRKPFPLGENIIKSVPKFRNAYEAFLKKS